MFQWIVKYFPAKFRSVPVKNRNFSTALEVSNISRDFRAFRISVFNECSAKKLMIINVTSGLSWFHFPTIHFVEIRFLRGFCCVKDMTFFFIFRWFLFRKSSCLYCFNELLCYTSILRCTTINGTRIDFEKWKLYGDSHRKNVLDFNSSTRQKFGENFTRISLRGNPKSKRWGACFQQ